VDDFEQFGWISRSLVDSGNLVELVEFRVSFKYCVQFSAVWRQNLDQPPVSAKACGLLQMGSVNGSLRHAS
jgi:hypothetical protein